MMPRLGEKYKDIEIEVMSKPVAEYQTDEYFELELPVAPAVMVANEIVVEGASVSQEKVEKVICRCLEISNRSRKRRGFWIGCLNKASGSAMTVPQVFLVMTDSRNDVAENQR